MKAIQLIKVGGVDNLKEVEIAQPIPQNNEVLVAVKALSINPADAKLKYSEEGLTMLCGPQRPIILGWDIAGTVVSVGQDVAQFKAGDRVFGMVNFPGNGQAYAEYVAAPAGHITLIPEEQSFNDAAATTLAAITALQVLNKGGVTQDSKVLIHAGSGGVGHFAIQIAKSMGAYVISTSSGKNKDFILSLGADEHINYHSQAFHEVLTDIDFVFDTLGEQVLEDSLKVIKTGGHVISIATMEIPKSLNDAAEAKGAKVSAHLVNSNGEDMATLASMLTAGSLKPTIAKTFPFSQLPAAHTEIETGRTVGKIIVTV